MKPLAASHSVPSASPSSSRPASSGLKTAGPRIAPKTEPNRTSAIPRARRSGGYMSPAAVRASSAQALAAPTSTSPASTTTAPAVGAAERRQQAARDPGAEARRQHRHAAEAVHQQADRQRDERAGGEHDRGAEPEQPLDVQDAHERQRRDRGAELQRRRVHRQRGRQQRRVAADRQAGHGASLAAHAAPGGS